jgi:hypothetical protein
MPHRIGDVEAVAEPDRGADFVDHGDPHVEQIAADRRVAGMTVPAGAPPRLLQDE